MKLLFNLLYLTILFKQANNEVMTTKIGSQTSAGLSDIIEKPNDINLKETTKNTDVKKELPTVQPKYDIKDFKVTKLKANHHSEDETTEACLANIDPEKIERVKKSIRNHETVEYTTDEDIKIAECLKKDANITETNENKVEDAKKANITETNENKVEDAKTKKTEEEEKKKEARRDSEYQFDPLDYYDEEVFFDNTTCPDKVEVIDLQLGEVKHYDLECEMITYWLGLADIEQMYSPFRD